MAHFVAAENAKDGEAVPQSSHQGPTLRDQRRQGTVVLLHERGQLRGVDGEKRVVLCANQRRRGQRQRE